MVEFTLILPVFLLMIFGMIDFGMALSKQHQLNQFTKEIARAESIGDSAKSTDMQNKMKSTVGSTASITVTLPSSPKKGKPIIVKSAYTYKPFTPLIHGFVSIPLSSTYETLIEAE